MMGTAPPADEVIRPGMVWRALFVITVIGAVLRFWGISFGLPFTYRPDEEYIVFGALGFHHGDFNPHFFVYPTFFLYLVSGVLWIVRVCFDSWNGTPGAFEGLLAQNHVSPAYLVARSFSAFLGTLSIPAMYCLAWRVARSRLAALAAAFLLAVCYLHVRESHYATTDVAVTLFSILALQQVVAIPGSPRCRTYLLAGLWVGLALSTKYTALALGVPFAVAHLLRLVVSREWPWRRAPLRDLACGLVSTVLCFAVGSPYFFLDFTTVRENFAYQRPFIEQGIGIAMPYGWEWLWPNASYYAFGFGMQVCLLAGAGWFTLHALRRRLDGLRALVLVVFVLALGAVFLRSHWLFYRYLLLMTGSVVVLVAMSIDEVHQRLPRVLGSIVAIGLIVVVAWDPLVRSIQTDRLLQRPDTRSIARAWLKGALPSGSRIAIHTSYYYGRPQLPPGYTYVPPADYRGPNDEGGYWLLVDSHPISYFSPAPDARLAALIAARGTRWFHLSPFLGEERPPFDLGDAFYVPVDQFALVRWPGSEISVYWIAARE